MNKIDLKLFRLLSDASQDVRHFPDGEERLVGHAPVIAGLTC